MVVHNGKLSLYSYNRRYLEELRQIATSVKQGRIDKRTQQIMRNAPIFLASKLVTSTSGGIGKADDDHDDDEMRTPHENRLLKPSEVSILQSIVSVSPY